MADRRLLILKTTASSAAGFTNIAFNASYTYNGDGIRTSKTHGSYHVEYYLAGSRILAEKASNGTTIEYVYDESGSPVSMIYNGEKYYFIKNLQGDVIQLRNAQNSLVANYSYDPWGKVLSVTDSDGMEITNTSHVAHMNPIRYRSYYYDVESGFYYLNSRYYDPVVARFIHADEYVSTGQGLTGFNMHTFSMKTEKSMCRSLKAHFTPILICGKKNRPRRKHSRRRLV